MLQPETRAKIDEELRRAEEARRGGLEGRARACARRAAGAAVKAYLEGRGIGFERSGAVDLLSRLQQVPDAPAEAKQAAEYLVERVDENYQLPSQADLLAETRRLVGALFGND